jgi:hypothetical protein
MRPDTAHPDLDPPDPSRRKMIGWVGAAGVAAFVGVPRLTRHEAPCRVPFRASCGRDKRRARISSMRC